MSTVRSLEALLPFVYDELRALARRHLDRERKDHTLQPTALVHEAYLRLARQDRLDFRNRAYFFGAAATMLRRILVNHERERRAQKRGGDSRRLTLHDQTLETKRPLDVIELDDLLGELASFDDRQARIVELRFFCGLTTREVAENLNVSVRTVDGEWAHARAWLRVRLEGEGE